MVLPPQRLTKEEVARVMAETAKRTEGEAKAVDTFKGLTLRMWCVERAVEAVGTEEGVIWTTNEKVGEAQVISHHSAVVPLAQEILNFVLASPN